MSSLNRIQTGRNGRFFYVSLCHDSLSNRIKSDFNIVYGGWYRQDELDNMIPWNRAINILLLNQRLEEENERAQNAGKK